MVTKTDVSEEQMTLLNQCITDDITPEIVSSVCYGFINVFHDPDLPMVRSCIQVVALDEIILFQEQRKFASKAFLRGIVRCAAVSL